MHSMQAYRHTLRTCIAVYGSQQIHCKYLADMAWILTFGKLPNYSVTESGFVIQFPVNNMHMCIPVHVHIPNSNKRPNVLLKLLPYSAFQNFREQRVDL